MAEVVYVTDPACPWSWAWEPVRHRLEREFGASLRITFAMGGLARDFGPAEALVAEWLDAGDRSGMPVDPRLWWEGPPASAFSCWRQSTTGSLRLRRSQSSPFARPYR